MRPAPTTSLFDQSALSEIADRLVTAARKAGADAADAVVVRSISTAIRGVFVGWGKLERTGTVNVRSS